MNNQNRHSDVGRITSHLPACWLSGLASSFINPAVLFNMPLGFVLAAQGFFHLNWIPACAGMTKFEVTQ
jgi:hypothetical protein